jgi:predicted nucleotidyltransferase
MISVFLAGFGRWLLLLAFGAILFILMSTTASEQARSLFAFDERSQSRKGRQETVLRQAKKFQLTLSGDGIYKLKDLVTGEGRKRWKAGQRTHYIKSITNKFPVDGARTHDEKNKVEKGFKTRELAQEHRWVLMELLCKFLELAEELKLVYFIYGGSLIGSWRHHGFIPYDDDIDIVVSNAQKPALLKAIKKLNPDYVGVDGRPVIKFWSTKSNPIKREEHRWPFIDILFFNESKTHIIELLTPYMKFNKSDVFPLHKRPFEGLMLDAPNNSPKLLTRMYGTGNSAKCMTWYYSHRTEALLNESAVFTAPCSTLKGVYPFVDRRFVKGKMEEKLMIGDKMIQRKSVDEPEYCWTPLYSYKAEKPK